MSEWRNSEQNNTIEIQERWEKNLDTIWKDLALMSEEEKKSVVSYMKEKKDTLSEKGKGIDIELNPENIKGINDFAKQIIQDNSLTPENQILLFNTLANNLSSQFPEISKALNIFWGVSELKWEVTQDVIFEKLNAMQSVFINKWYFINTDRISTWDDLIMKIEGQKKPTEAINKVFWNDIDITSLKSSVVLDDRSYEKFWFNIWDTSVVNKWQIKNFIELWHKKGRYTNEQVQHFDLDNIAQATVNHETSHAIMPQFNFPERQELDLKSWKDWMVSWVNFIPSNTVQIDEFIAHSIWQATDDFEIMTNVYSALEDLQNQKTFDIQYEVGKKKWDYWLVRAVILEELKGIFKEKWISNFDSLVLEKIKPLYSEQIWVQKEYKKLMETWKKDKAKDLATKWGKEWKGEKLTNDFNVVVWDVLKMLTPADYQRIKDKFLNQAKIFVSQIKETYSKGK